MSHSTSHRTELIPIDKENNNRETEREREREREREKKKKYARQRLVRVTNYVTN